MPHISANNIEIYVETQGPSDGIPLLLVRGPGTQIIQLREEFISLIDLGATFGLRPAQSSYENSCALLIGSEDGQTAALVVDEIIDQRQVVIKGLQRSFSGHAGIAAATILGNGQIALILDPSDIAQSFAAPVPQLQEAS